MTRQQIRQQERRAAKAAAQQAKRESSKAKLPDHPGCIEYQHLPTVIQIVKQQMAAVALHNEWPRVESGEITEEMCMSQCRKQMERAAALATRRWRRFYGLANKYEQPHQGIKEISRRKRQRGSVTC